MLSRRGEHLSRAHVTFYVRFYLPPPKINKALIVLCAFVVVSVVIIQLLGNAFGCSVIISRIQKVVLLYNLVNY